MNDAARVERLLKYFDEQPPFEAIGMVVVAAAELELNTMGLALAAGIDPKKVWYRDKRAKFLRSTGALPEEVLDRIEAIGDTRDLLAHGVWLNLFERGQAFIRPQKEDPRGDLRGQLVSGDDLSAWRQELLELDDVVRQAREERERRAGSP